MLGKFTETKTIQHITIKTIKLMTKELRFNLAYNNRVAAVTNVLIELLINGAGYRIIDYGLDPKVKGQKFCLVTLSRSLEEIYESNTNYKEEISFWLVSLNNGKHCKLHIENADANTFAVLLENDLILVINENCIQIGYYDPEMFGNGVKFKLIHEAVFVRSSTMKDLPWFTFSKDKNFLLIQTSRTNFSIFSIADKLEPRLVFKGIDMHEIYCVNDFVIKSCNGMQVCVLNIQHELAAFNRHRLSVFVDVIDTEKQSCNLATNIVVEHGLKNYDLWICDDTLPVSFFKLKYSTRYDKTFEISGELKKPLSKN